MMKSIEYIPKRIKSILLKDKRTWNNFGITWKWAIKQKWWLTFTAKWIADWDRHDWFDLVNPDRFADALYEFLKERHDEKH